MQKQLTPAQKVFLKNASEMVDKMITANGFTVEKFSSMMGLSRSQLYRKIKAATGSSVSLFIRSRRLNYALRLLESGEFLITSIAKKSGFSSESYFRACFKHAFGTSPGKYVRSGKIHDVLNDLPKIEDSKR